jgi:hypothetical protein
MDLKPSNPSVGVSQTMKILYAALHTVCPHFANNLYRIERTESKNELGSESKYPTHDTFN